MTAPLHSAPPPGRRRSAGPLRRLAGLVAAMAAALAPVASNAQEQKAPSLSIIRDAEIEQLLRDYAAPIFRVAGIPAKATRIVLIHDRSFNAFVANGRTIFLNIGVLMDSETPNEVIGVIAHEAGHIAGGHLARLRQEIANAKILSVVGMLAGAAAIAGSAAGGARVGNSGVGAFGGLLGGQEMVRRNLLSYQRSEEQAADRAAVRFLDATQQSADGLLTTFRRFSESGMFTSRSIDPYTISHPLPRERIAQLETLAQSSPNFAQKDSAALRARHDLMRAKLFGFIERGGGVSRRYPGHDNSLAGRYARAIAVYKAGRASDALPLIEALVREQPKNPYFHELKGQVLLESGKPAAALEPLRRAVALAPSAAPIRLMLGQALVATGNPALTESAIRELVNAAQREPETPDAYKHLSYAYAQKGDIAMAELSAAQYAHHTGDWVTARTQATRALAKLPKGSPSALRAEDIANFEPPSKEE